MVAITHYTDALFFFFLARSMRFSFLDPELSSLRWNSHLLYCLTVTDRLTGPCIWHRRPSAPVVGWPPVRSFRRNLAHHHHGSSSKQPTEPQNSEASRKEKPACKKNPLVKINMDGIPIGRKVDLAAYDSYERLSLGVKELFHGFLQGAKSANQLERNSYLDSFLEFLEISSCGGPKVIGSVWFAN
jgi:hypothetical protein